MAVGNTAAGGDVCEKRPNVAEKSELDRQNSENFLNVVKKLHFGRSGKKMVSA